MVSSFHSHLTLSNLPAPQPSFQLVPCMQVKRKKLDILTGILILPPGDLLMGVEKQLKYSWRGRNLCCMTLENLMNEHMEDMK